MKKILSIAALIALAFASISCEKESENKTPSDIDIIGTWTYDGATPKASSLLPNYAHTVIITNNTITVVEDMFPTESPVSTVYNYTRTGNELIVSPKFAGIFAKLTVIETSDGIGFRYDDDYEFFFKSGPDKSEEIKIEGKWYLDATTVKASALVPIAVKSVNITTNSITLVEDLFPYPDPKQIVYIYSREGDVLTFTPKFLGVFESLTVVEIYKGFGLEDNDDNGFYFKPVGK
ncbi:MAG: hypothetical protein MJY57_03775 [Bacteroidales bacterium]|nr:hypothetical protein [Bacteroidales bacterium]